MLKSIIEFIEFGTDFYRKSTITPVYTASASSASQNTITSGATAQNAMLSKLKVYSLAAQGRNVHILFMCMCVFTLSIHLSIKVFQTY